MTGPRTPHGRRWRRRSRPGTGSRPDTHCTPCPALASAGGNRPRGRSTSTGRCRWSRWTRRPPTCSCCCWRTRVVICGTRTGRARRSPWRGRPWRWPNGQGRPGCARPGSHWRVAASDGGRGRTGGPGGGGGGGGGGEEGGSPPPLLTAMVNHCRGLVARDLALVLSAAAYFQQAGRPLDRAQAVENAAALEAARGDLAAADRYLAEALGIYTALGAAWEVERAGARLRPHGVRPKRAAYPTRPVSGWEALTPTEVKIAYLVAEGRSNPDVAEVLFLSRYTVQTHVSHILAKLGARSRREIRLEAARHPAARHTATA